MFDIATRVRCVVDSGQLNNSPHPTIIISASGPPTGGRILHHVVALVGDRRNAILLSGFQLGGTRGAALLGDADRARNSINAVGGVACSIEATASRQPRPRCTMLPISGKDFPYCSIVFWLWGFAPPLFDSVNWK